MIGNIGARLAVAALAVGAFAISGSAAGQSDGPHKPGMQGSMGGMETMEMMQGCPMMRGGGGMAQRGMGHGMPQLPPGNEKMQLQMHADMMRAMADVLTKYAARLPDRK